MDKYGQNCHLWLTGIRPSATNMVTGGLPEKNYEQIIAEHSFTIFLLIFPFDIGACLGYWFMTFDSNFSVSRVIN